MRRLAVTFSSALSEWRVGHVQSAGLSEGVEEIHALVNRVVGIHREHGGGGEDQASMADPGRTLLDELAGLVRDGEDDAHLSAVDTARVVHGLVDVIGPLSALDERSPEEDGIPHGMRPYLPALGLILGRTDDPGVLEDRRDPEFVEYALTRNADIGRALKVSRRARARLDVAPPAEAFVDAFLDTDLVGQEGTLGADSYWLARPLAGGAPAYTDDRVFAARAVAGPDPRALRRVAPDLSGVPAGFGDAADLRARAAAGALFAVDLRELHVEAEPGRAPLRPGYALHAVEGGTLRPLGIWFGSGWTYPASGAAWAAAKQEFGILEVIRHELYTHLGTVHFGLLAMVKAVRGTCTALAGQSAAAERVRALVHPHLRFVTFNMAVGAATLIPHDGLTDALLAPSHTTALALSRQAVLDWRATRLAPAAEIAARGCDDPAALPFYPYRERSIALWNAARTFVNESLSGLAASDLDAFARSFRTELRQHLHAIVDELTDVHDLPPPGPMPDFEVDAVPLDELLTGLIAMSSFVHAAVNYPQLEHMMVVPAMPGAADDASAHRLPLGDRGALQMEVLFLLGSRRFDGLGASDYPGLDPVAVAGFRRRLRHLETVFEAEERLAQPADGRIPYPYLHPSRVPAAANV